MKIEMGESLFYSWLRHVKDCQIVQTNWKPSPNWELHHEAALQQILDWSNQLFSAKYGYKIFKQNASLLQILRQGECDVLGIGVHENGFRYYAVDVAFHEDGLNYGTKDETVMKVVSKCIRTAICLVGYLGVRDAEIIFASPKINPSILSAVEPCLLDANKLLRQLGYDFELRLIANEDFRSAVLKPILMASEGIADTSELFIRSYQMFKMFSSETKFVTKAKRSCTYAPKQEEPKTMHEDEYREFKVGKLAQVVLRKLLESGAASAEEIELMQTARYSKESFGLNYPLLVRSDGSYESARYYSTPLIISGVSFQLCSQWFETDANNDRPFLIKWIEEHSEKNGVN